MSRESFQLSIPTPCQEDWNQMIPEGNNKHCQKCSTLIVDFTQMSDREITDFFENPQGRICGRLTTKQIQKIYHNYTEEKTTTFRLPRIAASWLLVSWLSLSPTINAQELKPEITEQVSKEENNHQSVTSRTLKGTVIDAKYKEPLIGTAITIENTERGTISDFDGNFELEIPDNIPSDSRILFRGLSYEDVYVAINSIDFSQSFNVVMKEDSTFDSNSVVVVGSVNFSKRKIRPHQYRSHRNK